MNDMKDDVYKWCNYPQTHVFLPEGMGAFTSVLTSGTISSETSSGSVASAPATGSAGSSLLSATDGSDAFLSSGSLY